MRKLGIAVVVVAAVAWLFFKTIQNTNAEPYTIERASATTWQLVTGGESSSVLLGLQPPEGLRHGLYQQIFQRTMVSLTQPEVPMPLLLRREYAAAGLDSSMSAEEVMALARQTGLENAQFTPVCMGQEQLSVAGSRQVFYAVFSNPAFDRFRSEVGQRASRSNPGHFDPAGLRPILAIAASDADFGRTPLEGAAAARCVAPVVVGN